MAQSVKQAIIKGTFILTMAGILTKLLGFFNRIFLASTIGAREIGVYQLIFPVYLIVHCICCQGFEMGIMKYVAEESAFGHRENVKTLSACKFLFVLLPLPVVNGDRTAFSRHHRIFTLKAACLQRLSVYYGICLSSDQH